MLAQKEKQSSDVVISNLKECVERNIARLVKLPYNITYLKTVNPELVIKIVREFLTFAPQEVKIKHNFQFPKKFNVKNNLIIFKFL